MLAQAATAAATGPSSAGSPSPGASPGASASPGALASTDDAGTTRVVDERLTDDEHVAGRRRYEHRHGRADRHVVTIVGPSPAASPATAATRRRRRVCRAARAICRSSSRATPLSVGTTVADPHVRRRWPCSPPCPRALRRTALGARATDTSIIVYESGGLRIEFGDGG